MIEEPLAGRTVVITRAAVQAADFARELEQYGAKVALCPTIEIRELDDYHRLDEAITHLYGYDWIIFTSVNAVDYFFKRLDVLHLAINTLDDLRVCAIGEATAERLGALHVHVDLIPGAAKAEGVFAALENFLGGREAFKGLNVLLPRAVVARDFLPKALEEVGARIDVVPVYRTAVPETLDRGRVAALLSGDADCVAFTSSSTVKNLALLFDAHDLGPMLRGVTVACLGEITAQTAVEFGLKVDIKPDETTLPALARAIAAYFAARAPQAG